MKRLPSATESSNGYVADLRIFKRAAKKKYGDSGCVCESMPGVVGSAFRWTIIVWFYKHWADVQFHIAFSFLLKKWMIFHDDWILALVTQTGPKLKKTISFGATSVGGRPQRLGNVIIKLFKCQSLCFSVNPWPPACFSGKMGTNTVCLFQETNF